jgi:hypothetical protein
VKEALIGREKETVRMSFRMDRDLHTRLKLEAVRQGGRKGGFGRLRLLLQPLLTLLSEEVEVPDLQKKVDKFRTIVLLDL